MTVFWISLRVLKKIYTRFVKLFGRYLGLYYKVKEEKGLHDTLMVLKCKAAYGVIVCASLIFIVFYRD